jgi:hypothetical protein
MEQQTTALLEYGLLGLMLAICLFIIFGMVRWIAKRFESDIKGGFETITEKLQTIHDDNKEREEKAESERKQAIDRLHTTLNSIRVELAGEINELRSVVNRNSNEIKRLEDLMR